MSRRLACKLLHLGHKVSEIRDNVMTMLQRQGRVTGLKGGFDAAACLL